MSFAWEMPTLVEMPPDENSMKCSPKPPSEAKSGSTKSWPIRDWDNMTEAEIGCKALHGQWFRL
jgi:hypothetical protein